MPRGMEGVRQKSAELAAKRASGPGAGSLWFKLTSGQETIVRFLEQDEEIHWCMVHEVPVEGRSWGRPVVCLDQNNDDTPCPGCERDLKKRFQGYINVIWKDAPVYKRDKDNRIVKDQMNDAVVTGNKDQVAVWSSGIRLFEDLDEINTNFKGLSSRRFKVKRKGEKLDTKYVITPEDIDSGPQPLTEAEQSLANDKYDLAEFVKPPTYDDFMKELGLSSGSESSGGGGASEEPPKNPFTRNR